MVLFKALSWILAILAFGSCTGCLSWAFKRMGNALKSLRWALKEAFKDDDEE